MAPELVAYDMVFDERSKLLFFGGTEAVVQWLEANLSEKPRWVRIGETKTILTESEYLDLAT